MNAFHDFPSVLHWTAQDLADAVPLHLSELQDFDAGREIGDPLASANCASHLQRNRLRHDYLPTVGFRSLFRVF
jgi:hypothetical protein